MITFTFYPPTLEGVKRFNPRLGVGVGLRKSSNTKRRHLSNVNT